MAAEKFRPSLKRRGAVLIVFGLSEDGRPRAGTFRKADTGPATKAAEAMGLRVLKITNAASREVASNLPDGKIHAAGRGFVPFVSKALFAPLQRLTGMDTAAAEKPLGEDSASGVAAEAYSTAPEKAKPRLPKSWDEIAVGDLVLAQDDDPKDGWWEAIVLTKIGETFAIRWRQGTQRKKVLKHKYNLALVWPSTDFASDAMAVIKPATAYPASWQAINTDHVVLAKEDGPMEQWWEADTLNVDGDAVTLRWRDYQALPTIVRSRLALALIYPNPGAKNGAKPSAV